MSGRVGLLVMVLAGVVSGMGTPADADDRLGVIDRHALAPPALWVGGIKPLAEYLIEPARNDREKARAIFTWITHRISYDKGFESKRAAEEVLANRRSTCSGYAGLFKALAEAAGMQVESIRGHSKGQGYKAGQGLDPAQDHSWNAVKIDGDWRLVDCTWGAGYLDDEGRFVRRFAEHNFLTPPEAFVWNHFPEDPDWQLLQTPISEEDYLDRVKVKPAFFDCGLWLVSHRSAQIETGDSLVITIGAPPGVLLSARLLQGGQKLARCYTFAQREAAGYMVGAVFTVRGEYLLRVYASSGGDAAATKPLALEYVVRAQSGARGHGGFPEWYREFLANNCYLDRPLFRLLRAGSEVEFGLRVPGALKVAVVGGDGVWQYLDRQGEWFWGTVWIWEGDVRVYAKFPGEREHEYDTLLKYVAR